MKFKIFENFPQLKYGFSDKHDGSMHRRLETDNRARYFKSRGINPDRLITADLVHGARVVKVSAKEAGTMVPEADGLVTDSKNVFLSATAADCFLLYCFNPVKNAVGIAHIGWRGLLAGMVENIVDSFVENFKAEPQSVFIGVGPGIRNCHFEISPADEVKFEKYSNHVLKRGGRVFVDLPAIIKIKLESKGIVKEHIEEDETCTYCEESKYFSYRRDKPKEVQPMVGYIGLV